jgi:hypothetical protein
VVFSSPLFLFGFLPIFLALYAMMPRRAVNASTLVGSVFFYAWGEPAFVFVAMSSALLDLLVVRRLAASTSAMRRERFLPSASLRISGSSSIQVCELRVCQCDIARGGVVPGHISAPRG